MNPLQCRLCQRIWPRGDGQRGSYPRCPQFRDVRSFGKTRGRCIARETYAGGCFVRRSVDRYVESRQEPVVQTRSQPGMPSGMGRHMMIRAHRPSRFRNCVNPLLELQFFPLAHDARSFRIADFVPSVSSSHLPHTRKTQSRISPASLCSCQVSHDSLFCCHRDGSAKVRQADRNGKGGWERHCTTSRVVSEC